MRVGVVVVVVVVGVVVVVVVVVMMRIACEPYLKCLKGRDHFGDMIKGRIMSKWVLEK
jgi:hypothetical protein